MESRVVMRCCLCFFFFVLCASISEASSEHSNDTGIRLVDWKFEHVKIHITITLFLSAMVFVKMIYDYFEAISSVIPESCILIVIGIIFGVILKYGMDFGTEMWELSPNLFLLILLPPIVLDAAHGLYQRAFSDIFGPVILLAVVGTAVTFLIIGFSLYGLGLAGVAGSPMPLQHCLLFGSLIVAVDPVAVLAIFEEIGVDKTLYFLVFGESLFNDAVTIVLYQMMVAFLKLPNVTAVDIVKGIGSFFTVSLGGAIVGLIFGVIASILTRLSRHSRILQPLIILLTAYLSYLVGDMVGWSGIISMIACGILQASYAFHNMSSKSMTVMRRLLKMWAKLSESIVFLFLGIELVRGNLKWHTGFCLWSLALCLVVRFLITFSLSFLLNKTNSIIKPMSFTEQFIIGYGGLRGAVAFSLASMIQDEIFHETSFEKDHFTTATLLIIMFTIFPMGISIKPLVKCLKIRLEETPALSIIDEISDNVIDHFTAAIESISGIHGHHEFREWLDHIDSTYVRPLLQNDPESPNQRIIDVYEKVALTLHYATVDHDHQSAKYLDKLCSPLRQKFLDESHADLCEHEHRHETYHKKGYLHGIQEVTSIYEAQKENDHSQPKMAFAKRRKLKIEPEVRGDDYARILKTNLPRRNAIAQGVQPDSDDYLDRMHLALRRKNDMAWGFLKGHHNRSLREMQPNTSRCCLPTVEGLSFRKTSREDIELSTSHDSHDSGRTDGEVVIEIPNANSVRFHVSDEDIETSKL